MQEVRFQTICSPFYSWLVRLSNVVDVWDELVVATYPDQRVGRRGSQLSVCTRKSGLELGKLLKICLAPLKVLAEACQDICLEFIPPSKPEFRQWKVFALFKHMCFCH